MKLDMVDMKRLSDDSGLKEKDILKVLDALEKNGFTPARKVPPEYVRMDVDLPGRTRPDELTKRMLVEEVALIFNSVFTSGPLPGGIFNTLVDGLDKLGLRISTQDPTKDETFQEMMEHDDEGH